MRDEGCAPVNRVISYSIARASGHIAGGCELYGNWLVWGEPGPSHTLNQVVVSTGIVVRRATSFSRVGLVLPVSRLELFREAPGP